MKWISATCECGVEFLREPHDDYPRCSECFFEHDAPALKHLTDEVTEKRPGPVAKQESRTAHDSETHDGALMVQSTDLPAGGGRHE